ncbi:MAG TPA: hypothetical protein VGJ84_20110 [Polyangiaceae bacterium]|jgi:uncharacterized protein YndB with AHSA1/START domain
MSSTRIRRTLNAPRSKVYNALIDANAIAKWKVPSGMTSRHDGLPPGVPATDNETGWSQALAKLAALVEEG